MSANILEYLEKTMTWLPEKAAFRDGAVSLTFRAVQEQAKALGSWLCRRGIRRMPVAVCMGRSPEALAAYLGCVYGGCFFVPVDPELPEERLRRLLSHCAPGAVLCDGSSEPMLKAAGIEAYRYEQVIREPIREEDLQRIRDSQIDADPVCVLYVSGAEVPKGVMLNHRTLMENTEHLGKLLKCSSNTVFGCEAPLHTVGFLKEWLCTLKYGACCFLIPPRAFSFPQRLVQMLNQQGVNTLCWTASMLTRISATDTFIHTKPEYITAVAFSEEPMPPRQLCLWRRALPDARFLNLYGLTETGGACCGYELTGDPLPDSRIPIGTAFPNTAIVLLDENGREASQGEICIRGSCLAMGYFREEAATRESFVPAPDRSGIPERILRTGDLGARNSQGQLIWLGRKDGRVKCRGTRIELGEIEQAAASHPGIPAACCQIEEATGKIQLFYTGQCSCQELTDFLKKRLTAQMLPQSLYWLKFMPMTPAGAIDRRLLLTNSRRGLYAYEAMGRPV